MENLAQATRTCPSKQQQANKTCYSKYKWKKYCIKNKISEQELLAILDLDLYSVTSLGFSSRKILIITT